MSSKAVNSTLGEEKIGKLILKYSVPAIIGQIVNMLYSVVDRIYIGNIPGVGGLAITGVGITMPITMIITGLGMLVGIGAAANISLAFGKGEPDRAKKILANGIVGTAIISILTAILGNLFAPQIMQLFGATDVTMPFALTYLRPILFGTIFNLTAFGLNGCISSDGNPKRGMMTMVIGAAINIILDPIFIFGLDMGIAGAAYATVISQMAASGWLLFYFFRSKKANIKLKLADLGLDWSIMKNILSIGSAPFLMQFSSSIVQLLSNNALLTYGGDLAIGAMAVITSICSIFIMPIIGLTHGCQPIMGYNFGAKKYARVRQTYSRVLMIVTAVLLLGYAGIMLIPNLLVRCFSPDAALSQIAVDGMRIYLFMLPLIGIQMVSTTYFQSVGKPVFAMIIGLTRQVIFLVPAFIILPKIYGLRGVWYAGPVADLLAVSLSAILIVREFKKIHRLEDSEDNNERKAEEYA
ncbi:MATE family efflux transporter [Butyricicoccus sp. Marseille-Q5471]|uniref:MATE family efflux transporter n=1 Tax=Butyricicoccus sp. Marseille-Q5471 TaxID=3039493 RepID=UPI0024BBFFF0|nr:MATE family efflux transporter [Butyricicoccus sp. Marseille-Q5471]